MLRYIWNTIPWKPHVEKRDGSRFTGPKRLKMAKFETFGEISRNIEIRAIWFSELRTVVIVASLCWKPLVFDPFRFRVIFTGQEAQQFLNVFLEFSQVFHFFLSFKFSFQFFLQFFFQAVLRLSRSVRTLQWIQSRTYVRTYVRTFNISRLGH